MVAETGHHANRVYRDQSGDFHLNGASLFDDGETDIADSLESTLGGILQKQDTRLTSAQVKALMATQITLVTAPAAGYAAIPVAVELRNNHGGTNDFVQTAGTDHLALKWVGGAEITELATEAQITTLIEASAAAQLHVELAGVGLVPVAATAIELDNNGAAEFTGNAGADNTLDVRVWYRLVPVSAFAA